MINALEMGIKVDDKGAIKSLDNVDKSLKRVAKSTKATAKMINAIGKDLDGFTKIVKDNAKATAKSTKQTKDLFGGVTKLVGAYMGFRSVIMVMRTVADIAGESLRLYRDQEEATRRLETIAKNVTKATDAQVKSLKDLSAQLQLTTTYGNEVYESGLSQILSFGTTAEQAESLAGSLGDLMAAQYGVNASSENAIQSANMLGKALNGQSGALTRAGILMDEHQKLMIKEGTQAQRVSTIIDVMAKNYGGLAEELAKTDSGKIKQADNAIGDMKETIGKDLIPVIKDWKTVQVDIYSYIIDNKDAIIATFQSIVTAAGVMVTFISDITKGFKIDKLETQGKIVDNYSQRIKNLTKNLKGLNEEKARPAGVGSYAYGGGRTEAEIGYSKSVLEKQIAALSKDAKEAKELYDKMYKALYSSSIAPVLPKGGKQSLTDNSLPSGSTGGGCDADCQKRILEAKRKVWHALILEDERYRKMILDGIASRSSEQVAETSSSPMLSAIFGFQWNDQGSMIEKLQNNIAGVVGAVANYTSELMSSIFDIKNAERDRESKALLKSQRQELDAHNYQGAALKRIKEKQAKEREKMDKEHFEANKKQQRAQITMGFISSIANAWSSTASIPFPGNVIAGGVLSGMYTGLFGAQLAANNAQSFADGGVVDGFVGARSGQKDNRQTNLGSGEMVLNPSQQRNLFDVALGKAKGAGQAISIQIENFAGGDSELARLEDMLTTLQSSGRYTFA